MTFTEDWFSRRDQGIICRLARFTPRGMLIEVGAWEGRSTVALANVVNPRTLHTVDTWAGAASDVTGRLAAERDVYATWRHNIDTLTAGNVIAHHVDWREFFADLDERVAFCFIDAEHTYTEVRDNIEAVVPLLAPGGVLCGDDVHHPDVARAVRDVLGRHQRRGSVWSWRAP